MMFIFTACGKGTEAETPQTDNPVSEETEIQISEEGDEMQIPAEEDLYKAEYEIETPYLTLKRADIWGEDIQVEQISEKQSNKFIFTTTLKEMVVELFTVEFTQAESEGFLIGVLKDKKDVNIYINVKTIEQNDQWTEEEFSKLNLLQEYVNEVIVQLYELENFEPQK